MDLDFDAIVRTLLALFGLVGAGWAGWQKWGKQNRDDRASANKITFDTILEVVERLQEENKNKDQALIDTETRCNDKIARIEVRVTNYENTVMRQIKLIEDGEQERRELRAIIWERDQEIRRLKAEGA